MKTNIWAILGLIFAFVFWPLGLVFSIVALVQLKSGREQGKGLAIAGLVISIVIAVITILWWIFALATFGAMAGL